MNFVTRCLWQSALEESADLVSTEYATDRRHGIPTRLKQLAGMKALVDAHYAAIASAQAALAKKTPEAPKSGLSADLIERLRSRNGNAAGFGIGPVCDEAADALDAKDAEIARLREDAGRYRWLRDMAGGANVGVYIDAKCAHKRKWLSLSEMDSAIDAASKP